MNDRIEKKQVLDAMRLIKQYCNEESGCEFCDFYRSGDCITTLSLPCSWDPATDGQRTYREEDWLLLYLREL